MTRIVLCLALLTLAGCAKRDDGAIADTSAPAMEIPDPPPRDTARPKDTTPSERRRHPEQP